MKGLADGFVEGAISRAALAAVSSLAGTRADVDVDLRVRRFGLFTVNAAGRGLEYREAVVAPKKTGAIAQRLTKGLADGYVEGAISRAALAAVSSLGARGRASY